MSERTNANAIVCGASAVVGTFVLFLALWGAYALVVTGWHAVLAFGTATMFSIAIDLIWSSSIGKYPLAAEFFIVGP